MKKGFTLVEMLMVIVVLSVLGMIAYPLVTNQIEKSKIDSYNTQINNIINASKRWAFDNDDLIPYDDTSKTVSINRIQKDGYLTSGDVIDPRTETNLTGCIQISYDADYKQHNYSYISECNTIDIQ